MPQDFFQRTTEPKQKEPSQGQLLASNPPGNPGIPSRRKNRKLPVQVQLKRGGELDPFTSHLIAWVTGRGRRGSPRKP